MVKLRAIHLIIRNPEGRRIATGRYDEDGAPVLVNDLERHVSGSIFELEEGAELDRLLAVGAVRHLTDDEVRLSEIGALGDVSLDPAVG